jgi:hypothetical protein
MSVWATAVQALDIAKNLYQISPTVLKSALGSKPRPRFALEDQAVNLCDTWEDLAAVLHWPESLSEDCVETELLDEFRATRYWAVGIEAIYQIVEAVWSGRFEVGEVHPAHAVEAIVGQIGRAVVASTQASPDKFLQNWDKTDVALMAKANRFLDASERFKRLRKYFTKVDASVELKRVDESQTFGTGRRNYYAFAAGQILFFKGAKEFVNKGLIILRGHLNILTEVLYRIYNIISYAAEVYADEAPTRTALIEMLELTISASARTRAANSQKVCRAFHKARALAQWKLIANVNEVASKAEADAYVKDGLNQCLDYAQYRAVLLKAPRKRRTELMHVYKWMPPPDFDCTRSFALLKSWHEDTRPSGADPGASGAAVELWEMVKLERKLNFAMAYHNSHGAWPPGLEVKGESPTLDACKDWEPVACLPYYQYGKDIVGQIKDKATVPAKKPVGAFSYGKSSDTSFLLWYMENAGTVDSKADLLAWDAGTLPEENYVKVAYKPEASKPDSRLFFIAPPRTRILLGELEGNLSRVAQSYPGSLQGKSATAKEKIIASVMDAKQDPPNVADDVIYENVIITFDLEKFSPKSNANVTKDYHDFWAKVYGRPEISSLARIGLEATIVHDTCGMRSEYRNKGADLEGFRGRMMTMFHADMLAAAARLAKARGFLVSKGVLSVFIDDGAIKVAIPSNEPGVVANALEFLKCMQEVYAAAGQANNPTKTAVSLIGGEILAEFFVNSKKQRVGLKAAMRLLPDYENPASTLPEELNSLFASAQGSVKDGADWIVSYKRLARSYVHALSRWSRSTVNSCTAIQLALAFITPKSFGGLGFPPLQALVTTACSNMTVEGLAMLNRLGRYDKNTRRVITKIVERPTVKREPLSILRDPLRVRAEGPVMVENRLTMGVVKWLEENKSSGNKYLAAYRNEALVEHATAVAEAMLGKDVISIPTLDRVWKATPLAYIESVIGKLQRAATIITLIGVAGVGAIRRKNARDVAKCASFWASW